VDASIKVKTIPAMIGIPKTKILAAISLLIAFLLSCALYNISLYTMPVLVAMAISFSITYLFIHNCDQTDHDYYFTALMDGTMIIQFMLVYGFSLLFNQFSL